MGGDVTIWLAFVAGVLSFLNPCTLPIFPIYLSYITGVSVKELETNKDMKVRRKLLTHSFFFLLGVSLIFMSLGLSFTFIGKWAEGLLTGSTGVFVQRIVGIFIIIMGLFVAGWIKIMPLMQEKRMQTARKPAGYFGTILVGAGFAAGWTPCIGPIFGSILLVAASNPTQGAFYTIAYIIGFAIPFIVLTFFIGGARWIVRYSEKIMKVGGSIMIVMGLVLFSGQMTKISAFFLRLIEDSWLTKLG